jgi:membrane protein implicated in regulation of membrane protease activity
MYINQLKYLGGMRIMDVGILLWLVIGGLALAVDLITSAFLFVWFTAGALVAIVLSLAGFNFTVQLISFIAVSVILMMIGYPIVKKSLKDTVKKMPTTEQGYIGREIMVDQDILEKANIKIDGIYWTVKNEGESIKKGDRVLITGIEGNKIVVKKL